VRAALLALVAIAACASTANAANTQYDPSYGTVALPMIFGASQLTPTRCDAINDTTFAITGVAGNAGRILSTSRQRIAITIAKSNGTSKRAWLGVTSKKGEQLVASDFDANGEFSYVDAPVIDKHSSQFVVRRTNYKTGSDKHWKDVELKLPALKNSGFDTSVNVLNLDDGGLLLVIDTNEAQRIYRFTAAGKPAKFGDNGVVTNGAAGGSSWYLAPRSSTPLLETWDHSLIVAASGRPGQPALGSALGLLKIDAQGKVVDGFADHGLWLPPTALEEEKPLDPSQKRLAPQTMSVVGGDAAGKSLTVLFGTKTGNELGTGTLVAAAQLSENGVQKSVSESFDQSSDGGDGGFPDAQPFTFAATATGVKYAQAWSQHAGGNLVFLVGKRVGLSPSLASVQEKQIYTKSNFMAYDFAATPNGKYLYACGALADGPIKTSHPWKRYKPVLRRIKF
jgi:hypothetical protein